MKLLLDVDGVLLNYVGSLDVYLKNIFNIKVKNNYVYRLNERYHEVSSSSILSMCKAFERSVDYQRLNPLRDAKFFLNKLYNSGARIRCVTAASNDATVITNRMINLENVFGKIFSEIDHVGWNESKKLYFTDTEEIYIEDKLSNLIEAESVGYTKTIFMKHAHTDEWNNERLGCWNWKDIFAEIKLLDNGK